jgi:hypothetical protein
MRLVPCKKCRDGRGRSSIPLSARPPRCRRGRAGPAFGSLETSSPRAFPRQGPQAGSKGREPPPPPETPLGVRSARRGRAAKAHGRTPRRLASPRFAHEDLRQVSLSLRFGGPAEPPGSRTPGRRPKRPRSGEPRRHRHYGSGGSQARLARPALWGKLPRGPLLSISAGFRARRYVGGAGTSIAAG